MTDTTQAIRDALDFMNLVMDKVEHREAQEEWKAVCNPAAINVWKAKN